MAKDSRSVRYGKFTALVITQALERGFPKGIEGVRYKERLIELLDHAFEPRKKGEPRKLSHCSELDGINYDGFDIRNPKHYAAYIREGLHRGYNANNSNLVLRVLLENL